MVKLIVGEKGTGKTKILLDSVNNASKYAHGNVVFICANDDHVHDVDHSVRVINAKEYNIGTYKEFACFLKGALSQNYDISHIFIDGLFKLIPSKIDGIDDFCFELNELADKTNIEFMLSLSADASKLPEDIKKFII